MLICVCVEFTSRGGGGGLHREAEGVTLLFRGSAASYYCPQPESSGEDEGSEGRATGCKGRYFV